MRLLGDSDKVAAMINQRRETIRLLLRSTRSMVHEVTLLVRDNSKQLRPTLIQLKTLMGTLVKNKDYLDRTLKAVTAQSRYFANATGNGPFVDALEMVQGGLAPWGIGAGSHIEVGDTCSRSP